ncbi:hypothetical protein J3R82DRAFT_8589 [Butyriboletus roseoflavus]|nr:hypothetical protein J3R82DRAFT_8589 [Butyriboletus roseoflavus]
MRHEVSNANSTRLRALPHALHTFHAHDSFPNAPGMESVATKKPTFAEPRVGPGHAPYKPISAPAGGDKRQGLLSDGGLLGVSEGLTGKENVESGESKAKGKLPVSQNGEEVFPLVEFPTPEGGKEAVLVMREEFRAGKFRGQIACTTDAGPHSLDGLQVLRFDPKKVMAHPKVVEWNKSLEASVAGVGGSGRMST